MSASIVSPRSSLCQPHQRHAPVIALPAPAPIERGDLVSARVSWGTIYAIVEHIEHHVARVREVTCAHGVFTLSDRKLTRLTGKTLVAALLSYLDAPAHDELRQMLAAALREHDGYVRVPRGGLYLIIRPQFVIGLPDSPRAVTVYRTDELVVAKLADGRSRVWAVNS
jgi:hypothetical protein